MNLNELMSGDTKQIAFEIRVYEEVLAESQKGNLPQNRGIEAKRELEKLIPLFEARIETLN